MKAMTSRTLRAGKALQELLQFRGLCGDEAEAAPAGHR
jgi:hypothetical protein